MQVLSNETLFGRFKLDCKLGEGGMGVVWKAYDTRLDQPVALKLLPAALGNDSNAVTLLRHEAQKAIQLTHPHIVRVNDLHVEPGLLAVAMEWIDGSTMSQLQRFTTTGVFQPADLPVILQQFIGALSYAHEKRGMIHRDLKPSNLMINREGELKIADFGIAAHAHSSGTRMHGLSGSGTPAYMSPQQVMGKPPAPTDDIYSFGATLYELLTGNPPFFEGDLLDQLFNKVPPRIQERRAEFGITNPAINPNWEAVIASCLEKHPADRPQSAQEIGNRLRLSDLAVMGNSAGQLQQMVLHHFDRVAATEQGLRSSPTRPSTIHLEPRERPANDSGKARRPDSPSLPQVTGLTSTSKPIARALQEPNAVSVAQTPPANPSPNPAPARADDWGSLPIHQKIFIRITVMLTVYPLALVYTLWKKHRLVAVTGLGAIVLFFVYLSIRPSTKRAPAKLAATNPAPLVIPATADPVPSSEALAKPAEIISSSPPPAAMAKVSEPTATPVPAAQVVEPVIVAEPAIPDRSLFTVQDTISAVFPLYSADSTDLILLGRNTLYKWNADQTGAKAEAILKLKESPDFQTYDPEGKQLYLGYKTSGMVTRVSIAATPISEKIFLYVKAQGLAFSGGFLLTEESHGGSWMTDRIYTTDGSLVSSNDLSYHSKFYYWDNARRFLYHFRDDTSPNDILHLNVTSAGKLGKDIDSPYHGMDGIVGPIHLGANGRAVLLGSGRLFDAVTLKEWTKPPRIAPWNCATNYEGLVITAGKSSDGTTVTVYDSSLEEIVSHPFPGTPMAIGVVNNKLIVLTQKPGGITAGYYAPLPAVIKTTPKPAIIINHHD